ncbi:MAG: MipA/OmpV family protein [Marinomonas colpomeniae]
MRAVSAAVMCLGLSVSTVQAGFQTIGDGEGWLVGGAVEVENLPYPQTDDLSMSLQPYIAYEWENLHIGVDDVSYEFFSKPNLSLTFTVQPRGSLADENDSPIFSGIDREDAIEAGLILNYVLNEGLVSQWYWKNHYFQDVSSVYKGRHITTELGYQREYANYTLDTSVGLIHQSGQLNHYLYGVNANEQSQNRPAFQAKESVHPFFEVGINYQFMNRSLLVVSMNIDILDNDLKESPLLERNTQASVLLGWVKIF